MEAVARVARNAGEVLAGIAVRREAYARKGPLAAVQAGRLGSRREHRAVPWVLDRGDGAIVATLLVHRIELALDGRVIPAYGIGSVGTLVAERRRGHAAALCRAACAAHEGEGRAVGLLFSDIAPAYYERLGFRASPATEHRCEKPKELAESGAAATLVPIDPRREAERLAAAWRAYHRGTLHFHRDAARLVESVEDAHDDWFFAVGSPDRGYVRLYDSRGGPADRPASLLVVEAILLRPEDRAPALRAVGRLAAEAGKGLVEGWQAPPAEVAPWFTSRPRAREIPMLRGAPPHSSAAFWAADHF
jgi:predicted N-acetyltransferase YhbS